MWRSVKMFFFPPHLKLVLDRGWYHVERRVSGWDYIVVENTRTQNENEAKELFNELCENRRKVLEYRKRKESKSKIIDVSNI